MAKFRKLPVESRKSPNFAKLRALRPGWTCPACGKGNAPDVKGCVHCAEHKPQIVMNAYNTPLTGGDMPRELAFI